MDSQLIRSYKQLKEGPIEGITVTMKAEDFIFMFEALQATMSLTDDTVNWLIDLNKNGIRLPGGDFLLDRIHTHTMNALPLKRAIQGKES